MTDRSGAFWQRHGERMQDPEFADHFKAALAQVEAVDAVVNRAIRKARAEAWNEGFAAGFHSIDWAFDANPHEKQESDDD